MADVKLTISGEDRTGSAFSSVNNAVDRLHSQIKLIGGAFASYFAADKLIAGFKKGIEAVDDFQQSVAKTAAMITSFQGGDNVAENYRRAKEYAEGLNVALQKVDSRTTLNLSGLQAITEEMMKQRLVLDTSNNAQVEGFTRLANAAAVFSRNGADEVQLRQEVASLLRGEVDQNSKLASIAQSMVKGPLKQQLEQWKQSGTILEHLGELFKGFGPAANDLANTWSAVKSSFETAVNVVLRAGFDQISKDICTWLDRANNYLKEHQDLIGNKIKQGWEGFKEGVSKVLPVLQFLVEHAKTFAEIWIGTKLLSGISSVIKNLTILKDVMVSAAKAAAGLNLANAAGNIPTTGGTIPGPTAGGGALNLLGKAGAVIGSGVVGYEIGSWIEKNFIKGRIGEAVYDWVHPEDKAGSGNSSYDFSDTNKQMEAFIKKNMGSNGKTPVLPSYESPEQIKENIKNAADALTNYKKLQEGESKIAREQSEIRLLYLKNEYDQGQSATRGYFEEQQQTALKAAQQEYENAVDYLNQFDVKRKELGGLSILEYTKKQGAESPEYKAELAKQVDAVRSMNEAQLNYGKTYLETEGKKAEALKKDQEAYASLNVTALESSANYVAAELAKQDAQKKTADYLRLEQAAREGDADALEALAKKQRQWAIDVQNEQNKTNSEVRGYATALADAQSEVDKLTGKDVAMMQAEKDMRDGLNKMATLQDQLALAWKEGKSAAIDSLSGQTTAQERLNQSLRINLDLLSQKQVMNGQIVGYDGDKPIYANGSTDGKSSTATSSGAIGFDNGVAIQPYVSPYKKSPFLSVTKDPFFTSREVFSSSPFVDMNGKPIDGHRASGGPVFSGKSYLIGEKGPEVIRMGNEGGTVIPNDKIGGDTTININLGDINISAPAGIDPQKLSGMVIDDLARKLMPSIQKFAGRMRTSASG